MKKYIIGIKDDELNIGLASVSGKRIKIKDEVQIRNDNMGKIIDTCSLAVSEDLKNEMEKFLIKTKHKSKSVELVIGLESIISRTIEIPYLNDKSLKTYIENNITSFFTVNMDEYLYDYKILKIVKKTKEEAKKMLLMLVVIPLAIIKGIHNLTEAVGLKLISTRIYPDIMMNVASKGNNVGILDIGPKKSLITIYENGSTFLYTAVNTQIDLEAESPYEDFVDEIEYFTDFYSSRHQGNKLDALYTFGDYQNEENFAAYVSERLAIPIEHMDYKANKKYASRQDIDAHPQMVISQIRNKEIFNKDIDFINEMRLREKKKKVFLPIHLLLILILTTALWAGGYWYYLSEEEVLYSKEIPESFEFISIQEEINILQNELDQLKNQEKAVEEIKAGEFKYNEMISTLQKAIPVGVTIKTVQFDKDKMLVDFNFNKDTLLAVDMVVAINNLDYFEPINITELELNDSVEEKSFQLIVKDKEKEGE